MSHTVEREEMRTAKRQRLKEFLTFTRVLPGRAKSRVSGEEASQLLEHTRALQSGGEGFVSDNDTAIDKLSRTELKSLLGRSEALRIDPLCDNDFLGKAGSFDVQFPLVSPRQRRRMTPVHDANEGDVSLVQLRQLGRCDTLAHIPKRELQTEAPPSFDLFQRDTMGNGLTPSHSPLPQMSAPVSVMLEEAPCAAVRQDDAVFREKKRFRPDRRTSEQIKRSRTVRVGRFLKGVAHTLGFEATTATSSGEKGRCRASSIDNMAAQAERIRAGEHGALQFSASIETSVLSAPVSVRPSRSAAVIPHTGAYQLNRHPKSCAWHRADTGPERLDFSVNLTYLNPWQTHVLPTQKQLPLHSRKCEGVATKAAKWMPNASGKYL